MLENEEKAFNHVLLLFSLHSTDHVARHVDVSGWCSAAPPPTGQNLHYKTRQHVLVALWEQESSIQLRLEADGEALSPPFPFSL